MDRTEKASRFYRIVWPQAPMLLRTARMLCHNDAEADDVAQETLIKAFQSLDRFTEGTNVRSWLLAILRNTRIDQLRAGKTRSADISLEQACVDAPFKHPDASPSYQELSADPDSLLETFDDAQVIEALKKLPEEIRWTLLLVDVEGLDHRDVAGILDVPEGTIKSRAHRGREMLRKELLPWATEMRIAR